MKILLVHDYGTETGGAEVLVFGLRDALRHRGHDVRVFTSAAARPGERLLADETCPGTLGRWRTLLQSANPAAARALRRTIVRFAPDIVHVNMYLTQLSPLILRALEHVPTFYYAMWYRAICPRGTRLLPDGRQCEARMGAACLREGCTPVRDWLPLMGQMTADRRWGGRFGRVAAISRTVAGRLAEFGAPHLRSAEVIYPGTTVVTPRDATELSAAPTVVVAGRLVPEKGIDTLIRAFAEVVPRHSGGRLLVIGAGEELESLSRLARDHGLCDRVTFVGKLPHAEAIAALRSAWCVSVPSVWEEPFGMVSVEAQMSGVPVLASRIGGLAENVVDGETGTLVPPGDAPALAAAIDRIFSDRATTLRLGRQAHDRARRLFDLDGCAGRLERIYGEMTASRAAAGRPGAVRLSEDQ